MDYLNNINFESVCSAWNSISSKIVLHTPDETINGNLSVFNVVINQYFVDNESEAAKTYGNGSPNSTGVDWNYCNVLINTNYTFDSSLDFTKVLLHELGHSLKLSHTFDESDHLRYHTVYEYEDEVISIMNYPSVGGVTFSWSSNVPTFIDKENLTLKWGV